MASRASVTFVMSKCVKFSEHLTIIYEEMKWCHIYLFKSVTEYPMDNSVLVFFFVFCSIP